ncbi:hypothetical protein [Paenibacillus sp. MBLB4367]|uniref:hypothetical protein n=1 Tax=Paenibacillus sp. MBLB4367 TaxID=3384767 RepID=UPI003908341D
MDVVHIERAIGRGLTDSERKTVEWVNGWERETKLNLMSLIWAARENGFAEGVRNNT